MNNNLIKRSLGIVPIAAASILGLVGTANAADILGPGVYEDAGNNRLNNAFGINAEGVQLRFFDPNNSGCTIDANLVPVNCTGDEYISVDFNPNNVPSGENLGQVAGSEYKGFVRGGTQGNFVYGAQNTAKGIAQEFYSTPFNDFRGTIGLDLLLGAYADLGVTEADLARIPSGGTSPDVIQVGGDDQYLFLDMDVQDPSINPLAEGSYADLLYGNKVTPVIVSEEGNQTTFRFTLTGQYARGTRTGTSFGDVSNVTTIFPLEGADIARFPESRAYSYDWQGIINIPVSASLAEVLNTLTFQKLPIDTTMAGDFSFNREFVPIDTVPEPSAVIGLLSVLGAGGLLKKKKQQ